MTVLLVAALVMGLLVNWMLHPTFPPKLLLDEPQIGSWSWLLHDAFALGREVTALAAALAVGCAVVWWTVHLLRKR